MWRYFGDLTNTSPNIINRPWQESIIHNWWFLHLRRSDHHSNAENLFIVSQKLQELTATNTEATWCITYTMDERALLQQYFCRPLFWSSESLCTVLRHDNFQILATGLWSNTTISSHWSKCFWTSFLLSLVEFLRLSPIIEHLICLHKETGAHLLRFSKIYYKTYSYMALYRRFL